MTDAVRWRKSSHSQNDSVCVELAHTLDAVRDSKNAGGPVLRTTDLAAFLHEVRRGRFDR